MPDERELNEELGPDDELDETLGPVIEDPPTPNFKVTAIPTEHELRQMAIRALCNHLPDMDLAEAGQALQEAARNPNYSTPYEPTDDVRFEIIIGEDEPPELVFMVFFPNDLSMFVVAKPADFDRGDPGQEVLFQKCLGILALMSEAPTSQENVGIRAGNFSLVSNSNDDEVDFWRVLRARWTAS